MASHQVRSHGIGIHVEGYIGFVISFQTSKGVMHKLHHLSSMQSSPTWFSLFHLVKHLWRMINMAILLERITSVPVYGSLVLAIFNVGWCSSESCLCKETLKCRRLWLCSWVSPTILLSLALFWIQFRMLRPPNLNPRGCWIACRPLFFSTPLLVGF